MQEPTEHSPAAAPPADVAFVERWAEFTKAFSIYPATNARVRGALDAMREHLPMALAPKANVAGGLEILFFQGGIQIADAEVDLQDGTNVEWLHQRVRKASLAVVTFFPDVEDEAILAFTARLLDLFTRTKLDAEFDVLWPEIPKGMRLQDQRFVGRFREDGEPDRHERRAPPSPATSETDTTGDQGLVDLLMEDEEIREALSSLQAQLSAETDKGETTHEVDVLGRLIQQMPPDAMDDRETLLRVTRTALQALESRVGDSSGIQALPDDISLLQLMFESSQGLLGRAGPTNEEVAVRLREHVSDDPSDLPDFKGHAGDEKIKDEADLFWQDVAALPPPFEDGLTQQAIESVPEQVGVFLHFLTAADQEEDAPLARECLSRRLRGAGRPEAAVLLPYLRPPQDGPDEAYRRRHDQILEFLHEEKLARLLRECGLLAKDTILAQFPRDFGLYLEALDPEVAEDRDELASIAASLGPKRIGAAAEDLVEVEGLKQPERQARILATQAPSMLPFVRILLEQVDRRERQGLVAAIRQLRGDDTVACLLSIVDEPELLPLKYLLALAGEDGTTPDTWTQRDLVAGVICRYLYATANRPEKAERRAYAVQHLEHFITPDARTMLAGLLSARRHLIFHREPKIVRQAARHVLRSTKLH